MLRTLLIALALATACATPRAQEPSPTPASAQQPEPQSALATSAWQALHPITFEAWLATLPGLPVPATQLATLAATAAQDEAPIDAVRAALILAHLNSPQAAAHLINQLEARRPHPSRPADAADTTAAAYLAGSAFVAQLDLPKRLAQLATGPAPHPDLEVRTECARGALLLGRNEVAPFLLKLTRLDTAAGLQRDGAWHSPIQTTWSRNRAAEALADRLQIPCPYRGDASLARREQASQTLETAWTAHIQ